MGSVSSTGPCVSWTPGQPELGEVRTSGETEGLGFGDGRGWRWVRGLGRGGSLWSLLGPPPPSQSRAGRVSTKGAHGGLHFPLCPRRWPRQWPPGSPIRPSAVPGATPTLWPFLPSSPAAAHLAPEPGKHQEQNTHCPHEGCCQGRQHPAGLAWARAPQSLQQGPHSQGSGQLGTA